MYHELDKQDQDLIQKAIEVIRKNYEEPRHTVGAAVLSDSGQVYAGVNVESWGYGPCAEPIAIGSAISKGERKFLKIVAVGGPVKNFSVMSPCGNCRQLLIDYAPDLEVIIMHDGQLVKTSIKDLIPDSYGNFTG